MIRKKKKFERVYCLNSTTVVLNYTFRFGVLRINTNIRLRFTATSAVRIFNFNTYTKISHINELLL